MPEGPQMVFLKEQAEQFIGQLVLKADGSATNIPFDSLEGQALIELKTYGKEILFCFEKLTLRVHLMFFGKYAIDSTINRELKIGLEFETGEVNFYAVDCRIVSMPLEKTYDWSIDVLNPSFNLNIAIEKLISKPKRLICDALLDQDILAGVGNGIKNEALFSQHVHPESITGEINPLVLRGLVSECIKVSENYLDWLRGGKSERIWQVYQQKQCPRDHIPLRVDKLGKSKRSSYYCEKCQILYLPDAF